MVTQPVRVSRDADLFITGMQQFSTRDIHGISCKSVLIIVFSQTSTDTKMLGLEVSATKRRVCAAHKQYSVSLEWSSFLACVVHKLGWTGCRGHGWSYLWLFLVSFFDVCLLLQQPGSPPPGPRICLQPHMIPLWVEDSVVVYCWMTELLVLIYLQTNRKYL